MRISDWSSDVCSSDLENRVADQLWLEVDGLTAQVLTGIYSAETHLPQPLRISVRARLAMADHYEPTTPLSGSKDYMHLKFAATEGIPQEIGRASCRARV